MPASSIMIAVIIAVVVMLIILSILLMWRKVPQDKAMVVTGLRKRVISGGGGFVVPLLERSDRISLENMKIEVRTDGALTEQGVDIRADGVAVLKVKSDKESILSAVEQFNTGHEAKTIEFIKDTAKDVLEGKLREIISKMSVEEIYKDREKFASQVQEVAALDLSTMGLEIKAFTIRDISDRNGYLEALGKPRIAAVKRDADIAEAEARKETKIKTSEATRLGEEASLIADTQIAEANKTKLLKIESYRKEQETAKAIADLAYEIEENKVQKEVIETAMQVEITKKEKEIELQEKESLRKEQELVATIKKQADANKYSKEKEAEARKYGEIQEAEAQANAIRLSAQAEAEAIKLKGIARAEAEAQAIKLKAEADAEAIKLSGTAEAEAIMAKGEAEAKTMEKKAAAFKLYNDAAVTQMIIEKLPEIAKSVSDPLARTEKIVIVDNGAGEGKHGASKVTGYVTDIMSTLPDTVEALTGYQLMDAFKKLKEGQNQQQE